MAMDIKIGKGARSCHGCDKDFVHEEQLTSTVRRAEDGWVREDFCAACWNEELGERAFSVWSATFCDPHVAEQGEPESFSPLRQAFYEAVEKEERASVAVAYLAGQLLRRQKVFRLIKETTDPDTDAAVLLFSDRIANRLIEVQDPNLTTSELERGRQELMERLGELEGTGEEDAEEETADHGENQGEYAQT